MHIHHVAIQVRDLERAAAFYGDLLGMAELRRQPHAIWLDADGTIVMLERCVGSDPPDTWRSDRAGLHLLAFTIDPDARTTLRLRLENAGHAVEQETDFTFYVRDPDGTRLGFSSWPHPSR